jgi:hypothetical protein
MAHNYWLVVDVDVQLPAKEFTVDRGSAIILNYHESIFSFLSEEVDEIEEGRYSDHYIYQVGRNS